jgi:hypothetical protein
MSRMILERKRDKTVLSLDQFYLRKPIIRGSNGYHSVDDKELIRELRDNLLGLKWSRYLLGNTFFFERIESVYVSQVELNQSGLLRFR